MQLRRKIEELSGERPHEILLPAVVETCTPCATLARFLSLPRRRERGSHCLETVCAAGVLLHECVCDCVRIGSSISALTPQESADRNYPSVTRCVARQHYSKDNVQTQKALIWHKRSKSRQMS